MSGRTRIERFRHPLAVAGLLALFLVAALVSLSGDSATSDETAHIGAGYSYLQRWDFRMNPEHPPLPKLIAALPVWLDDPALADYDSAAWRGSSILPGTTLRTRADQWVFGFELLNGPRADPVRRDPADVLVPARTMMAGLGVLLGLAVYGWTRELWGPGAALVALTLYALSPTMLAHTRLVTTDLPAALGFFVTLWTFWRWTRKPTWPRALVAGVALGVALLIKFSALLLPAMLVGLAVLYVFEPGRERWELMGRASSALVVLLLIGAVAWGAIWAGHGFRYLASPDPEYQLDWEVVDLDGIKRRAIDAALERRVLPQAYLYGLAYTLGGAERRLAYLNGEQRLTGWWHYFPEAFALKTPPATLALVLLAAGVGFVRFRGRGYDGWFIALPVLIYLAASMASSLNIGHRHLTVIYPLLFAGCGSLAALVRPSRLRNFVGLLLFAGLLVSFVAATPRYLTYFNGFAGGPDGGPRYLLDSNIDWGQDLGRLARLLERRGIDEVHLAYFGTADPRAYGIRFRKVHLVHDFYPELRRHKPDSGEWIAISVNLLHGLYTDRESHVGTALMERGLVDRATIDVWVKLRDKENARGREVLPLPEWLVREGHVTEAELRETESRTVGYFLTEIGRTQQPVDRAGDSILLFRMP